MKQLTKAIAVMVVAAFAVSAAAAPQTLYPTKDGTLVDGDVFGPFDGLADDADWYFNQSSYEGLISRATASAASSAEHRVVWEYDLAGVAFTPPVSAMLHVILRGAPVFPRPDAEIHVYSYEADLQEALSDFSVAATRLHGVLTVAPYAPPTAFSVDVSSAVDAALTSGANTVGFRFQIDPNTPHTAVNAFIDALDSDVATKPYLVVDAGPAAPGDIDGDGDVDLADFQGFPPCVSGPAVAPSGGCGVYDFDADSDVDVADYGLFQTYLTPAPE